MGDVPTHCGNSVTEKKKPKVLHACIFCRRSKMTCDDGRPCQRCIKRKIAHLCADHHATTIVEKAEVEQKPEITNNDENMSPPQNQAIYDKDRDMDTVKKISNIIDSYLEGGRLPRQPYSCDRSYEMMIRFCEENYTLETRNAIQLAINSFRPFVPQMKSQYGVHFCASEEYLQNCLIEYDRVLSAVTTPFIVFRRSGEILKASATFAAVIQIPKAELEASWSLYELITEDSFTSVCEKIIKSNMDVNTQSIITNCVFVPKGFKSFRSDSVMKGLKLVPCNVSITPRRDSFFIPILFAMTVIPVTD